MKRTVGNVAQEISTLMSTLGLEKVGAAVVEDPGTAQPAKQDASRSLIQSAPTGARSAENTTDVNTEVPGDNVGSGADNGVASEPASSTENITGATYTGEDPAVENDYNSNEPDPGTAHPASVNNKTEKYSSEQLNTAASDILAEVATIEAVPATDAPPASTDAVDGDVVVKSADDARDFIVAKLNEQEAGEKTAAEATANADEHLDGFLGGFAKAASLVGLLTADMIDGMVATEQELQKKAEGEVPPEMLMQDAIPAEQLEAGAAADVGAAGAGASELAAAAVEVAADMGISPEEVLALAEEELAGGGGGVPAEGAAGIPAELGAEALAPEAGGMEVAAAVDTEEVAALRKKAAEYDEYLVTKADAEKLAAANGNIADTVKASMNNWWETKQAELAAVKV